MGEDVVRSLLEQIAVDRIRTDLFYLASDPLPVRKLNFTIPGHTKNTLYEADEYIQAKLPTPEYAIEKEGVRVQAFRRNHEKPIHAQYERPEPEDPWYTAYNIYAKKRGVACPDEVIVVIAHKDSQSWIDSPGGNDNAIGTVCTLEMARVLADYVPRRSIWFVWCNEEHAPWTSVTTAQNARRRGDNIVAVFNNDGLGRNSPEEGRAGQLSNVTVYTEPEGEELADTIAAVNETYDIGLTLSRVKRERPGDDDGSFINAGYPRAVLNIGSYPYKDPNYHTEGDTAGNVNLANAVAASKAVLAAIVHVDRHGVGTP